ncbi:MAG: GxxExxY protein [Sedimentisphaerales bacterium]|nr:GxxExxY protein [Sedimentisphaerales bacterium]
MEEQYPHKELTGKIIGAAMEVYNTLGCGFLESVYEEALVVEFRLQNIDFERQKSLDVFYKGTKVKQFVCDFLVADDVLVELKATKDLTEIDKAQVLNYLKSTNLKLGLLLNFGAGSLQYKRVIN